jgi:hypothetical protein
MRRILWWALVGTLALAPPGCKQKTNPGQPGAAVEGSKRLASTVRMGDRLAAGQLASGFHGVENNAWRWTERKFAIDLGTPAGAAEKGAILELKLTVPPPTIAKLQSVTLSASVGGTALAPETYSAVGQHTYRREILPGALAGETVRIDFELDKAMSPGGGDVRELGIVANSIGLTAR